MTESAFGTSGRFDLPEDLRDWVDERAFIELVYQAMQLMDESLPQSSLEKPLPPGAARVLTTVLAYSYARAIYGSEDIARVLPSDLTLEYLTSSLSVCPDQLRAVRRHHRARVQIALATLLRLCWERRIWAAGPELTDHPQNSPCELRAAFERAAERRINCAVLADSMALDN